MIEHLGIVYEKYHSSANSSTTIMDGTGFDALCLGLHGLEEEDDLVNGYQNGVTDSKENEKDDNDSEIDIDNDYLLNEGIQILSDYTAFNQNIYLSEAA